MIFKIALLALCVGFVTPLAGCRSEHFATEDQWWLTLLDEPHRRGSNHYCVADQGPNRPVRRGEASYCLTSYADGITVYRRDSDAKLIQGWRSWIVNPEDSDRWVSLRDSVFQAVTGLVGETPKCRDAAPEGLMRITSWHLNGYQLAVITHDPASGGLPTYKISVALGEPADACGDPAKTAA